MSLGAVRWEWIRRRYVRLLQFTKNGGLDFNYSQLALLRLVDVVILIELISAPFTYVLTTTVSELYVAARCVHLSSGR